MNFIKVSSIAVISTIIVLIILSKMGIVYMNLSFIEKGKELLKIDETSQLLKLEYPKVGEDMYVAFSLYEDIAFESDDQVDFYILERSEKIFVEYENNTIQSMWMILDGDIDQLRTLGEKMLPNGSSYIAEDYFTKEEKNEFGRYTKKKQFNDYYYELPEEGKFAIISVIQNTNDLLGANTDSASRVTYTLEISLASEEEILKRGNEVQEVDKESDFKTNFETYGLFSKDSETNKMSLKGLRLDSRCGYHFRRATHRIH